MYAGFKFLPEKICNNDSITIYLACYLALIIGHLLSKIFSAKPSVTAIISNNSCNNKNDNRLLLHIIFVFSIITLFYIIITHYYKALIRYYYVFVFVC